MRVRRVVFVVATTFVACTGVVTDASHADVLGVPAAESSQKTGPAPRNDGAQRSLRHVESNEATAGEDRGGGGGDNPELMAESIARLLPRIASKKVGMPPKPPSPISTVGKARDAVKTTPAAASEGTAVWDDKFIQNAQNFHLDELKARKRPVEKAS
ncbi:unnamed protein product [Hyaloperonospora brassicae]|uniref:RxLR effector protein n=1 Tax=Hyaloperonospora brassicae TaxID=162125 RepID=A0AAV0U1Y7_HYABA|nr:unnamed protein product [Hyaloperonospora brassicae]